MNKWMTLASTLTVTVVVLTAAACSQQSGEPNRPPVGESRSGGIEGTVADAQGRPLEGIRVAIISGTAAFPEIAPETDAAGNYQIGGVQPGTYQVAALDRDGQRVDLETVDVNNGATATLDFSILVTTSTSAPSVGFDLTPLPTPTPWVTREWALEGILVDGSTVTVLLRVYAGSDVWVTLDSREPNEVNAPPPVLEFVFQNVASGKHTVLVEDVVGHSEITEVVVPPLR